jgi:hypothetical protein
VQALLGTAVLADCVPAAALDPAALALPADRNRFLQAPDGWWAWVLTDPRPLARPVFWAGDPTRPEVPDHLLAEAGCPDRPVPPTVLVRGTKRGFWVTPDVGANDE